MSLPNNGMVFSCQYYKLLAVKLSICGSCLESVCFGQLVTGVKSAAGDLACGSGGCIDLTEIN